MFEDTTFLGQCPRTDFEGDMQSGNVGKAPRSVIIHHSAFESGINSFVSHVNANHFDPLFLLICVDGPDNSSVE
jgi:hypothetical protein